jgi:ParB family chromosome partitioning protein
MGSIDLDPASSELANRTVLATEYFTKQMDGLQQKWYGNVWLNPPYSQPLMSQFSDAIVGKCAEYEQAIILVNNATETQWFQQIAGIADVICMVKGRIKFIDTNGNPSGAPLQGQCIFYVGDNTASFIREFNQYGTCLKRIEEQ